MGTPFEFGLVANTLKEHRWFFNMQLLTGHGYVPTIMPEASEKYIVSTMIIRKSYYVIGIVFEKYLFSSVNWR